MGFDALEKSVRDAGGLADLDGWEVARPAWHQNLAKGRQIKVKVGGRNVVGSSKTRHNSNVCDV